MPEPIWTNDECDEYAGKMFVNGFWLGFFIAIAGFAIAYLLFGSR